jgi:acetylornithine deacetylase
MALETSFNRGLEVGYTGKVDLKLIPFVIQQLRNPIRAAKAVTGLEPEVGWGVWTDADVFKSAGIPTVNIGPSGFGLHEPVEWVDF